MRSKQTNKPFAHDLIKRYSIITDQVDREELGVILHELEGALQTGRGAVVEFGCYEGTTSLFMQRIMQHYKCQPYDFHVYDSFQGLPVKTQQDTSPIGTQFVKGKLHAKKSTFITNFKQANLPLPWIHKGWFEDLTQSDIPENICFAFLDGDYYSSIMTSLRLIENKLSPHAVIVVDDYQSEALPGAKKAVDEWVAKLPGFSVQVQASLAIIKR